MLWNRINGQSIDSLRKISDSLIMKKNYQLMFEVDSKRLILVEYKYYRNLNFYLKNIKLDSNNYYLLYRLREIPFWTFLNQSQIEAGREIYISSTTRLINYSINNLTALYQIEVIPSCQSYIYPLLKKRIEQAGGIWNKGELPKIDIYPPIK